MRKIKAPKGKVLKAYLFDKGPFSGPVVRHVLIDEWGLVFIPTYAWSDIQSSDEYKIIALPNPVERGNERNNKTWNWDGWWSFNWKCDSWAWCYAHLRQEFVHCYAIQQPDGGRVYFAH